VLEDLDSREPVVVFVRFRHDLDVVRAVAEAGGRRVSELSGRAHELEAWQRGDTDVLATQIQSGSLGVTMVRARYAIYYSDVWSLAEYDQSLARLHRPGQKRSVTYIHLAAEGTIDQRIYAALQARKEVIQALLDGFKGEGA